VLKYDGVAVAPHVASATRFTVKWNATDDDVDAVLTCAVGDGITYAGATGAFTLHISASKTAALPTANDRLRPFVYELYYVLGSDAWTLKTGPLYVESSVQTTVDPA
jgi:hypothetical protein